MNTQDFIKALLEDGLDNNTIINFVTQQQAKLDQIRAIVGNAKNETTPAAINQRTQEKSLIKASKEGWHLYSPYHWSRSLNGKRLDYWPTKSKFMYEGQIITGDVAEFIKKHSAKA